MNTTEKINNWIVDLSERAAKKQNLQKPRQIKSIQSLLETAHKVLIDNKALTFELATAFIVAQTELRALTQSQDDKHQGHIVRLEGQLREICAATVAFIPLGSRRALDIGFIKGFVKKIEHVDHFIVCDLEMTCKPRRDEEFTAEIIEFGAVVYNKELELMGQFSLLVKPSFNPVLDKFCVKLTGIQQDMVDSALRFPEAHHLFSEFVGSFKGNNLFVQWGSGDLKQIKADENLHCLRNNLEIEQLNLKNTFSQTCIADRKKCGLKRATEAANVTRYGMAHRALSDAMDTGEILKITIAKLREIAAEHSKENSEAASK